MRFQWRIFYCFKLLNFINYSQITYWCHKAFKKVLLWQNYWKRVNVYISFQMTLNRPLRFSCALLVLEKQKRKRKPYQRFQLFLKILINFILQLTFTIKMDLNKSRWFWISLNVKFFFQARVLLHKDLVKQELSSTRV